MGIADFTAAAMAAGPQAMAREIVAANPGMAQHPEIASILGADMAAFEADAPARARDRFLDAVTRRGQGRKVSTRPNYGMSPSTAAINAIIDRQDPGNVQQRAAASMAKVAGEGWLQDDSNPRVAIENGTMVGTHASSGEIENLKAAAQAAWKANQNRRASNRNRANAFRAANAQQARADAQAAFMGDMAQRDPRAFEAMMKSQMAGNELGLRRELGMAELGLKRDALAQQGAAQSFEQAFKRHRADMADKAAQRSYNLQLKDVDNRSENNLANLENMKRQMEASHAFRMAQLSDADSRRTETARHNANLARLEVAKLRTVGGDVSLDADGNVVIPSQNVGELGPSQARAALERTEPGFADEIVQRIKSKAGLSSTGESTGFGANAAHELHRIVDDLQSRGKLTPEVKALIKNAVSPELRTWVLSPTTRTDGWLKNRPRGQGNTAFWTTLSKLHPAGGLVDPWLGKDEWNREIETLRDVLR